MNRFPRCCHPAFFALVAVLVVSGSRGGLTAQTVPVISPFAAPQPVPNDPFADAPNKERTAEPDLSALLNLIESDDDGADAEIETVVIRDVEKLPARLKKQFEAM